MTVRLCWFVLTSYLSCDLFLYIGIKALFRAAQAVIILSLLLLCIVSRCDNKDFINTLYLFVMMICVQVFMLGLYELAAVHCEKAIKLHGIYTFIHCINTFTSITQLYMTDSHVEDSNLFAIQNIIWISFSVSDLNQGLAIATSLSFSLFVSVSVPLKS